jgi:hypothetical protein
MSDIAAYVMSANTLTLQDVCDNGSVTTTGITVAGTTTLNGVLDANSTADISGNTTIGGTVDINNTADISDTLTLSKPSGTGLNVTSNATIGGTLTLGSTSISSSGITTGTIISTGTVAASFLATDPSGAPASSSAAGILGSIVADANYIYICTATNTWKRVAIATW